MGSPKASVTRAKAHQVVMMTSVWLDIDVEHEAHQKKNLPKTIEAAKQILAMMPVKPTFVIFSGHGLQAWWLFAEPIIIDSEEARARAARLMKGWNELLRRKAESFGLVVDSVHDLARLMRVPGTRNCKGKEAVDCVFHTDGDTRYLVEDLEDFLPAEIEEPKGQTSIPEQAQTPDVASFNIDPAAQPPAEKYQTACENLENFEDTFKKARKDLKDQSFSAYDQSLANQAVGAGWTDQDIVNLLIAFRRKHGGAPKNRRDYFIMTITKARRAIEQTEAEEALQELAAVAQAHEGLEMAEDEAEAFRRNALEKLSKQFGFRVLAIEKTMSDPPIYSIRTERGLTVIGGVEKLDSGIAFRRAIMNAMKVRLKFSKKVWDDISVVLMNACEDVDVGPEATLDGRAISWIQGYLSDSPPVDIDKDPDVPMREFYPVLKRIDGAQRLCIETRDLRQWIKTAHGYGDRVEQVNLGMCLRSIGAVSKTVRMRKGGASRRCWVVVPDPAFMPPPDQARQRLAAKLAEKIVENEETRTPGSNQYGTKVESPN
jgi:hypothetical protein